MNKIKESDRGQIPAVKKRRRIVCPYCHNTSWIKPRELDEKGGRKCSCGAFMVPS